MEAYLRILIPLLLMMCGLRALFSEFDSRMAKKHHAISYFLRLEDPIVYRQMPLTILLMASIFIVSSGIDIFSKEGFFVFIVIMAMSILCDVLSYYFSIYYCRFRFKPSIEKARSYLEEMKQKIVKPVYDTDIVFEENLRDFKVVANEYIEPKHHVCVFSGDGGDFLEKLQPKSQVTFLIDREMEIAKEKFQDSDIRVVSMKDNHQYPFKDQRMDVLVLNEEDFNPDEALRVLKDQGIVVLKQKGSKNLMEMNAFSSPKFFNQRWDLEVAKEGLQNNGFEVLDGATAYGTLAFKSVASFFIATQGITHVTLENLKDYIDQFHFIDASIQKNGSFKLKTHHFYVVGRKK